jgi:lipoprotein NlpI
MSITRLACALLISALSFHGTELLAATKNDKANKATTNANAIVSEGFRYDITPLPSFVQTINRPVQKSASSDSDQEFLLQERQISLLNKTPQRYVHTQTTAYSSNALESVSQVYIQFNPAFEQLALHAIRVWRDGKAIDLTKKVKLDLLRRESNLEKSMYEGDVTAIGILPDIRVQDIVELEYTVSGSNPVFGNHYADLFYMMQMKPVREYRFRMLYPDTRQIAWRLPPGMTAKESSQAGIKQIDISQSNIKPYVQEDKTPGWYLPQQLIEISEYKSWDEVNQWASGLFAYNAPLSGELQQKVQEWQNRKLSQAELAVEVLRWVQQDIRYFGIEMGENSHLPATPDVTFSRKYGDCKDKSLLLTTMLRALGIEARPTLASLSMNRNVEKMLPSHAVFDHAIVQAVIEGKTYWLDATRPPQYGKLSNLSFADYGYVLVLNSPQLLQDTRLPDTYESLYQRNDTIKLPSFKGEATLVSVYKATRNAADSLRQMHEQLPAEQFNHAFQDTLLRLYPHARTDGNVEYADDQTNNQVTITTRLNIADLLSYEPGRLVGAFYATEVASWAELPQNTQRSAPFGLAKNMRVVQTFELEFPLSPQIQPAKTNNNKPGEFLSMSASSNTTPQKYSLSLSLKANKEAVPAQRINDYTAETRKLRDQMGMTYSIPINTYDMDDLKALQRVIARFDQKYGSSNSGRAAVRKKDQINLIVVSRDIASGKLTNSNLAKAYKLRANAYDDKGDSAQALKDIRMAQQLDPENPEYRLFEAATLLGNGEYQAAITRFAALAPSEPTMSVSDQWMLNQQYAQSLLMSGKPQEASEKFSIAIGLADNSAAKLQSAIWQFIASGSPAAGKAALTSVLDTMPDDDWPRAVAEMLTGKISPDELIAKAASTDIGVREDQYSEAYFYLGKYYQMTNQPEKAREAFGKCLAQGVTEFQEHNFATLALGKPKTIRKDEGSGFFD